jgi:hypothetical protein
MAVDAKSWEVAAGPLLFLVATVTASDGDVLVVLRIMRWSVSVPAVDVFAVAVWGWWGMWGGTLWMWGTVALRLGGWGAVAGVVGVFDGFSFSSFLYRGL